MHKYDVAIIGAGIQGVAVARELSNIYPDVVVLERNPAVAMDTTGRCTEVAHTALSYEPYSLKAQFCNKGNVMLWNYCRDNSLPVNDRGEVIVAKNKSEAEKIYELERIASKNGTIVMEIDENGLREIEPYAKTCDVALYSPDTFVTESVKVTASLAKDAAQQGTKFLFDTEMAGLDVDESVIRTNRGDIGFGYLVNCAGLGADRIAQMFGAGQEYTIIPFRGDYRALKAEKAHLVNGCIYPVPDRRNPFLGVHFTKTVYGDVLVGPNAVPVLGRRNYKNLQGARIDEMPEIFLHELELFANDRAFRELALVEAKRLRKKAYAREAAQMLVGLGADDFWEGDWVRSCAGDAKLGLPDYRVRYNRSGIRAQLFNKRTKKLEKDFIIRETDNSFHWLNGISPGYTCALPSAEYIRDRVVDSFGA